MFSHIHSFVFVLKIFGSSNFLLTYINSCLNCNLFFDFCFFLAGRPQQRVEAPPLSFIEVLSWFYIVHFLHFHIDYTYILHFFFIFTLFIHFTFSYYFTLLLTLVIYYLHFYNICYIIYYILHYIDYLLHFTSFSYYLKRGELLSSAFGCVHFCF